MAAQEYAALSGVGRRHHFLLVLSLPLSVAVVSNFVELRAASRLRCADTTIRRYAALGVPLARNRHRLVELSLVHSRPGYSRLFRVGLTCFCFLTNQGTTSASGVKRQVVQNHDVLHFPYFSCKSAENGEPTSGLEPLTCSLRVIHQALQGCAAGCKSRISRAGFSARGLLRVAPYCVPGGIRVVSGGATATVRQQVQWHALVTFGATIRRHQFLGVAVHCRIGLFIAISLLEVARCFCVLRPEWCQKWCQTVSATPLAPQCIGLVDPGQLKSL